MKKSYRKPDIIEIVFVTEDILTTSGPDYVDTHNSIVQQALNGGIDWFDD